MSSVAPAMGKGRLESLTDGIFSTVMTVLVLSLSVPLILSTGVSGFISGVLPLVYDYVLSFLILAVFWIRHHQIFHIIARVDSSLLWLNLIFLMTIGFVPFSTELLGRFPINREVIIIYGANLMATGVSLRIVWQYAKTRNLLTSDKIDERILSTIDRRLLFGPFVYLAAILVSLINPEISVMIFALNLVFYIIVSTLPVDYFMRRRNRASAVHVNADGK